MNARVKITLPVRHTWATVWARRVIVAGRPAYLHHTLGEQWNGAILIRRSWTVTDGASAHRYGLPSPTPAAALAAARRRARRAGPQRMRILVQEATQLRRREISDFRGVVEIPA